MPEELTLLPCPACGEEADILDSFERDGNGHVAIGWSAYCTRRCLTTSERGSREEAAALWNALPRALVWTNEPPKVPGMYWNRSKNYPNEACIIKVSKYRIEQLGQMGCSQNEQWAGPIPEPREPKE